MVLLGLAPLLRTIGVIYISLYVMLHIGRSKVFTGQYVLYYPFAKAMSRNHPGTRAVSRYCLGRWLSVSLCSIL